MNNKKSQSGRSMVEMLGVIAIIGLITIGGITSMGYVDSYFRVNSTVIEVDNLAADIADTYSWSTSYSDIDLNEMCEERSIDDCITTVDGTTTTYSLQNRWGGAITIASADGGASFEITYTNVPLTACQQIYETALSPKSFHYVTLIRPASDAGCTDESTLVFKLKN